MHANPILKRKRSAHLRVNRPPSAKHAQAKQAKAKIHACRICLHPRAAHRYGAWCDCCLKVMQAWAVRWQSLGLPEACPADLVEERIARYRWRAERGLDLFEQPLSVSLRE